jgi:hypothetical protein
MMMEDVDHKKLAYEIIELSGIKEGKEHIVKDILDIVADIATAAERERCARVAEEFDTKCGDHPEPDKGYAWCVGCALWALGQEIAAAIRKGENPQLSGKERTRKSR